MTSNSNALAVYDDGRFDLMQRTARAMVESGFFQDSKQLAQAVVKVMAGAELGISPFASMTGIHIVQGKPTLSSNLIATLVKNDPRYNYRVRISTDVQCVIDWYEEGERIGESEFTIKEAQAAGLTGKSTWKQYPSDMLFARALTRGARRHAPGIFGGAPVYTPEEMGADVNEEGDIVDVTPEPHQAPEIQPVAAVEAEVSTNGNAEQETPVDGENDAPATPMKKPTPAQLKAMHAAGSAYYGQEWDTKRPELVSAVTKGRTTSSKHLTADECQTITDGINRKANAANA